MSSASRSRSRSRASANGRKGQPVNNKVEAQPEPKVEAPKGFFARLRDRLTAAYRRVAEFVRGAFSRGTEHVRETSKGSLGVVRSAVSKVREVGQSAYRGAVRVCQSAVARVDASGAFGRKVTHILTYVAGWLVLRSTWIGRVVSKVARVLAACVVAYTLELARTAEQMCASVVFLAGWLVNMYSSWRLEAKAAAGISRGLGWLSKAFDRFSQWLAGINAQAHARSATLVRAVVDHEEAVDRLFGRAMLDANVYLGLWPASDF